MNTKEIKEYIYNYYSEEYPDFIKSIDDLEKENIIREIFCEYNKELERESYRWWDEVYVLGNIGDKNFGWTWAVANRDLHVFDLGWEFDWDSVCEMEARKEIIEVITWVPKK